MHVSKKGNILGPSSCVNFKLGCKLFNLSRNAWLGTPSRKTQTMSSTYIYTVKETLDYAKLYNLCMSMKGYLLYVVWRGCSISPQYLHFNFHNSTVAV